jgi:DNA-binding PadR family transcriptional regulator
MRDERRGRHHGGPIGYAEGGRDFAGHGFGRGFSGGDGFGGGEGHGRRGGGGPRGRMFARGELRLLLLKLIAEQSRHGYELIKAIEEMTGGRYAPSPGVVYPTLSLLVDEGLIAETGGEAARKAFAATNAGRGELAERTEEVERVVKRLVEHGREDERRHAPPVARAIANLLAAVRGRAAAGELDRDTVHQIADILDEAARKVERL